MDKKVNNKSLNFFKKEGFYVILFVCLCIVATAAVLVAKTRTGKTPVKTQAQTKSQTETPIVTEVPSTSVQNALEVKEETNSATTATQTPQTTETKTAAVSNVIDTTFAKPVDGSLVRPYSEQPVMWKSSSSSSSVTYRPNFGIDIKADLGKPVIAVMDGIVKEVTQGQDGVQITIYHPQNGLKTVYANLDAKVSVTVSESVKKGSTIGKIGGTTIRAAYEDYGKNYLHFEVIKDNNYVDPAKYIKY
jgi:murein DD-endopeptidase MepM/ murein hydrolase activator NlpD